MGLVGAIGPAAAAAIGVTGAVTGVGVGLFNYNRGNFRMDQKLHYARFNAGYSMAIAQTKQYREDLVDLSNLTCTRMDVFHAVSAMSLTILTALFCPGRLGLHTSAPPSWLMGLMMANVGGCYLFLLLTMWLAMHASMRADTAITHMLTRFVRLPVPNTYMLDRARKFMANYEEQGFSELFRFPFTKHQKAGQGRDGGFNEEGEVDADTQKRTRHDYDVPLWYRKEKHVDQEGHNVETMLPYAKSGTAPEHFEVYREIQNEWWPYDVYARVSVFLAIMHLMHAWGYHQIGHALQEQRAPFAGGTVVITLFVTQQLVITLDCVPSELPFHRVGPFSLIIAYVAACIEYMRWFDAEMQAFGFVLVFAAYIVQIIYTYQLLRMCEPSENALSPEEKAAGAWWPGEWKLPAAFHHAVWLVAPPKQLDPGMNDLAGEMKQEGMKSHAEYGSQPAAPDMEQDEEKRRDVHRALGKYGESPAWRNVQIGLVAMLIAWVWLLFGFTIEVINQGTDHPSLLSAPGLPNWTRDPRWRAPKPGREHAVEVGLGGMEHGPLAGERHHEAHAAAHGGGHEGGEDAAAAGHSASTAASSEHGGRRLAENVAEKIRSVLPQLQELASLTLDAHNRREVAPIIEPAAKPPRIAVQWPPLFEPRVLACAPRSLAATPQHHAILLSRQGRGAVVTAAAQTDAMEIPGDAAAFALEGIVGLGPLLTASWDNAGLLLLTSSGAALECPGFGPSEGRWHCKQITKARLFLGTAKQPFAGAVAVSRGRNGWRAAVAFPGENVVALFSNSGAAADSAWLPAGESRIAHASFGRTVAATFSDENTLLLTSHRGELAHITVSDGRVAAAAASVDGQEGYAWQGACSLASGDFARLAMRSSGMGVEEAMLHVG